MAALVDKTVLSWFMLVTIFVTFQMMNGVESGFFPKAQVGIINTLPVQLDFHCKDKTRDDGFHTLPPGQTYHFEFKIEFLFKRTQWFCQFNWYRKRQESHYFDIYVQTRDNSSNADWKITTTGACKIVNPTTGNIFCYPWNELQGRKKLLISNTTTEQESPLS
ncbi:hypothetical protein Lal_00033273 [Lupinus albus]|uniref:S-protein homolog n=1 Tax=Lupinus albus TaxID=3870 RepID=A0A6A5NBU9_LUPAL|nr:putative plant self-incompatibility S1 [Lupinus albus]KAF1879615.1 hypothetical protein Lal_00033273 [Lupinus albus]